MHSTNKAFDRYFDIEADDIRSIYQDTAKIVKIDNGLITETGTRNFLSHCYYMYLMVGAAGFEPA